MRTTEDGDVEVLHTYEDGDPEESLYCCCWMVDSTRPGNAPLLLVAGGLGVVKEIDTEKGQLGHYFLGHGNAINSIRAHPTIRHLFATASKDESVRLWNLKTRTAVLIMGGSGGHCNEVLCLDFHPQGKWLVTCGMDRSAKIWNLEPHSDHIASSNSWSKSQAAFPTRTVQFPLFSTNTVHPNYVDCVRCVGDLVCSKSVDNQIVVWKPDLSPYNPSDALEVIHRFPIADCGLWFVKFSIDRPFKRLVVGNCIGKIFLFNLETGALESRAQMKQKIPSVIRMASFNSRGDVVMGCCDDGSVLRLDIEEKKAEEPKPAGGPS